MRIQIPARGSGTLRQPPGSPKPWESCCVTELHRKLLSLRTLSPASFKTDLAPQSPFPRGSSSFSAILGLLTCTTVRGKVQPEAGAQHRQH